MAAAAVALLAEGVDRNLEDEAAKAVQEASPSSRRAWIEINDRLSCAQLLTVALLAEGVDRNRYVWFDHKVLVKVALLAEGVDRNPGGKGKGRRKCRSPSSRRAWIEITLA